MQRFFLIQASEIMKSLRRTAVSISAFKEDSTFSINFASSKQAQSSNNGIDKVYKSPTLIVKWFGAPIVSKF